MERLSKANCIQEKLGSCTGCPMQDSAIYQLRNVEPKDQQRTLAEISKIKCPKGNMMQMPISRTPANWGR